MRYSQCSDTPRVVSLCSKYIMSSLLCFWHIVPWKLFHKSIWRNLKEHSNINELLRLSHVTAMCSWFAPQGIYSKEQEREALGTPKTEELSLSHAKVAREVFCSTQTGRAVGKVRERDQKRPRCTGKLLISYCMISASTQVIRTPPPPDPWILHFQTMSQKNFFSLQLTQSKH